MFTFYLIKDGSHGIDGNLFQSIDTIANLLKTITNEIIDSSKKYLDNNLKYLKAHKPRLPINIVVAQQPPEPHETQLGLNKVGLTQEIHALQTLTEPIHFKAEQLNIEEHEAGLGKN